MTATALKANILAKLGVKSVAILGHGPEREAKIGSAAVALSLALGIAAAPAPAAAADADADAENSRLGQAFGAVTEVAAETAGLNPGIPKNLQTLSVGAAAASFALAPERTLVEAGVKMVAGAVGGASSNSEGIGQHVAEVAAAAVGVAYAGPLVGAYIVYNQANKTYQFFEDRQEKATAEKLDQVADRVARIQQEERLRIRLDERAQRAAQPESVRSTEQQTMLARAMAEHEQGALSGTVAARLETEKAVIEKGGKPEEWFVAYQRFAQTGQAPSESTNRERLVAGLEMLDTKVSEARASFAASNVPEPKAMTLR